MTDATQSSSEDSAVERMRAALASGASPETLDLDTLDDDALAALSVRVRNEQFARAHRRPTHAMPRRALALAALDVLTVPAPLKTINAVTHARTGAPLDGQALAATRRDERRAWYRERAEGKTPGRKLAPALHHQSIDPVHGLLTVSTWHLRRRVVTPHSARVEHPAMVIALIDEAERLADDDRHATCRLTALACRLAVGIPGAARIHGVPDDPAAVRRAALRELNRFATIAADEQFAAARAMQDFNEGVRMWGRTAAARGGR